MVDIIVNNSNSKNSRYDRSLPSKEKDEEANPFWYHVFPVQNQAMLLKC